MHHPSWGTRLQKEKAATGHGAFGHPEDAKSTGIRILPLDFVFGSRTSLDTRQAKTDKQRLGIYREIIMMKLMNHPSIIRIYDVYESYGVHRKR